MKIIKLINKDITKRSFFVSRIAALVFAAGLAIGMANCDNANNSIPEASHGLTTIRVAGSDESGSVSGARTILPGKITTDDISKYVITLRNENTGETKTFENDPGKDNSAITGAGVKYDISDGNWTVTVDAYRMLDPDGSGTESEYKTATGTETLTVSADGVNTVTVPLRLIENDSTLNGVFYWNLVLPSGVTLTTFTLNGAAVPHTVNNLVTSGSMKKAAGVYKLNIVLTKTDTGQTAGIYEAVHIYAGLVTEARYDFTGEGTEFSFADEILIAGSLNITRTGPAEEAVAYTVQGYSDEACTKAIDCVTTDIDATNITSGPVNWYISIPAPAYAALSSKIVYLKANIATSYYSYLSQPLTDLNIGPQGVADVSVSIQIEQNPSAAPGHPIITESDSQLTVQWSAVDRATSYEVWTNTTNNSATARKYGDKITGTSATITGLTNGTIYYVWVKAQDYYGVSSGFSPVASGMPGLVFQGLKLTINTGSSNSFILPIKKEVSGLNLTIDWGDGNIQTVTTAPTNSNGIPHTYSVLNTDFIIRLTGSCKTNSSYPIGKCGFGFGDSSTGYNASSNKSMIRKAEGNITALTTGSTATSHAYCRLFYGCSNLNDISGLVFSETSAGDLFLYDAFYNCTSLTSLPNGFLSNITTASGDYFLYYTFNNCTSLTSLPDNFLGKITTASGDYFLVDAFYNCTSLTSLPNGFLSNITTASGDYFLYYTFNNFTSLTSLPNGFLSKITTASGDYFLSYAFRGCTALTSLPDNFLGKITTASGEYFFSYAFYDCTKLNYIDLFSDTTSLTLQIHCFDHTFTNVASSASPKLTLRLHGTKVLKPSVSYSGGLEVGLNLVNLLGIYVKSNLVSSYQNSIWSQHLLAGYIFAGWD